MKYQIFVHLKNENYSFIDGDEKNKYAGYIISFKGVFSSIKEGLFYIYHKYENILKCHKIHPESLSNHIIITKINTDKCEKWEKMYLNQKCN